MDEQQNGAWGPPPQEYYGYGGWTPPPAPPQPPRRRRGRAIEISLICISLSIVFLLVALVVALLFVGLTLNAMATPASGASVPAANSFSVITIEGTIQDSGESLVSSGYNHQATVQHIEMLAEREDNKGILLYFNTGGGKVYQSDEVYRALVAYKEKTGRPIWGHMGEACQSGGYYIAVAADRLIADYGTLTGSIGVYINMTDSSGLYDKLGIESVVIRSGDNKGAGIAGAPINEAQREAYQDIVDEQFGRFVSLVAEGRGMTETAVRKVADGRPYTAARALELGLVDELSTWEETLAAFEEHSGGTPYYPGFSGASQLSGVIGEVADALPKSDLDAALALTEGIENGVPMAWAPGLAAG